LYWNKIKSHLPEILLFGAVIFLQFYRLGIGEIQSHDESRYIMRAEACLEFGAWLDQTQYALSGLFSSTHPPLVIWMMALLRYLFGASTFVSRLVSPIAAVVVLIFFYKLALKFFSRPTALFATAALCLGQNFLLYSHKGQFDIPMLAFVVIASYYAIRSFEEKSTKLAIIAGIAFGCVLMSKAVQGLYLLPFICALPYVYPSPRRYKNLGIILGVFLVTALPWYLFMLIKHIHFYGDYAGLIASLKNNSYAEGATKSHWWYYLNTTNITFPLLVIALVSITGFIQQWKNQTTVYNRFSVVCFVWFFGSLIFLSNFYTRMLHFSLFLLMPAALVLCFSLEEFFRSKSRSKILVGSLLLIISLGWSLSDIIRMHFKDHAIFPLNLNVPLLIACIAIALILSSLLYKYFASSRAEQIILVAVVFMITTGFYRWTNRRDETFVDGAEAVGNILVQPGIHTLTAYHDGVPYQYMMPQLQYYTGYKFIGWDSTRSEVTKTWKELDSMIAIDRVPRSDASVIYNGWDGFYPATQEDKALLERINSGLNSRYSKSLHTKKYQLYWEPK
jgi:4-amino-4-deoxy-L-arabinose transferase